MNEKENGAMNGNPDGRKPRARFAARLQSGVVSLEFAVAIPIVLMMSLAMVDFGRVSYQSHVLLDAAHAGVRVGALPTSTTDDVEQAALAILASARLESAEIEAVNVGSDAPQGSSTSVTVSIPFKAVSGTFIPD